MTSKPVISVENLSKQYDLGVIGTGTLSRDLNRWWARVRKQPDPYTRIGQRDAFERIGESILALDDVSFQVQQGEALGIIGRNGAGKSTLLKILSRVTAPTNGVIKIKGRIGSLLEVGTGFHPELTGRENVYLNGAILGMKKAEVTRKFDEIVDFAGVKKFIDTPVKRYSSGMYVRLAFAVAAHLESEILIVDEVLAVGDAEFQKKCLGKMGDVAGEGRTVLFVSHNMSAVKHLCNNAIVLKKGQILFYGGVTEAIDLYLSRIETDIATVFYPPAPMKSSFSIISVGLVSQEGDEQRQFQAGEPVIIKVATIIKEPLLFSHINISCTYNGEVIFRTMDTDDYSNLSKERLPGSYTHILKIESSYLRPGIYYISVDTGMQSSRPFEKFDNVLSFEIIQTENDSSKSWAIGREGLIKCPGMWQLIDSPDYSE